MYQPPAPHRPPTVTVVAGVQLTAAVLAFLYAAVNLVALPQINASAEGYSPTAPETRMYLTMAADVVAAAVLVVLAVMLLRGRQWARLTVYAVCGVSLVCCGWSMGLTLNANSLNDAAYGMGDPFPAWYVFVSSLYDLVTMALAVVSIVFLSVRPSVAWFAARSRR